MARVKGPLFSIDASGSVASAITFSKWKGQNYVRQHFIPSNPQTKDQMYTRGTLSRGVIAWQAKDAPGKLVYDTAAEGTGMSGFNLFLSEYMKLYV
jgi:hypothetical protein